jgi:hypothetical protein
MAVVLVDQDGVLAGFEQGLFGAFKAKHPNGPVVAVADRRGFYAREHYEKLGPEWGKAVDAIIRTEGFYRNLDPVGGALAALEEMRQAGHHVLFDAPYNQGQPGPRLSAWADWREVLEPVLAGQQRPDTAVPD